jgi:hypothetical protein
MTAGLLISRSNKTVLHKIYLKDPTPLNFNKYKNFRNIYNSTLRKSKKLYFESNLLLNAKNPQKTWELLKEATNLSSSNQKIEQIKINNIPSNNPSHIAEEFNRFFSEAGVNISKSVNPTLAKPDEFIPPNPNPPNLEIGLTSLTLYMQLYKISLQNKALTWMDLVPNF